MLALLRRLLGSWIPADLFDVELEDLDEPIYDCWGDIVHFCTAALNVECETCGVKYTHFVAAPPDTSEFW